MPEQTAKLQIELSADLTGDGRPEIKLTPVDVPIGAAAARAIDAELKKLDEHDYEPGDGEFDSKFRSKIPVRIAFINGIPIDGKATIRIKF